MRHMNTYEVKFDSCDNIIEISRWLRQNCSGTYSFPLGHDDFPTIYCPIVYFETETDAMVFKLRWL